MSEEKAEHPGWGGKRNNQTGRPKGSGTGITRERVQISIQPDDLVLLKAAAEKAGKSFSEFVVDAAKASIGAE